MPPFRRVQENRISSDRQPGIGQANIRGGPTGRTIADSISALPERPTIYPLGPGLDRIDKLPGAKPPFGFRGFQGFDTSETARENYISRTGGGYPDRPRDSSTFMDRYEDYPFLLEDPNPRITPKGRRVGPRHWQVDKDMFKDMMIPDMKIGRGIGSLMPYEETAVDPSDWRILQQIIKAGENPDDYTQTASTNLMQTSDFIDILNDMYNSAIQSGNQRSADTYLEGIQSLMGTLPRAARGGLMSLRR
jgi:hypothetical protein